MGISFLRQHVHILAYWPIGEVIVACAAIWVGLACTVALMAPPARQTSPAVAISANCSAFVPPQAAAHCERVNEFSRNLKLPRAPRHRGERPTSGVEEVEAVTSNTFLAVLDTDSHEPFVIAVLKACPLAGHPVSLLRPPSLLTG